MTIEYLLIYPDHKVNNFAYEFGIQAQIKLKDLFGLDFVFKPKRFKDISILMRSIGVVSLRIFGIKRIFLFKI